MADKKKTDTRAVGSARWEYKQVMLGSRSEHHNAREDQLNALGTEGWELVAISDAHMFFKRTV